MNGEPCRFGTKRRQRGLVATVGCLLALVALALASDARPTDGRQTAGRTVILDVVIGERPPMRLGIREETRGKLAVTGGPTLELTPRIDGEAVELTVVAVITSPETGEETRRMLATLRLAKSAATTLEVESTRFTLTWADQRVPTGSASGEPCSECCITCLGVTLCGCIVITPCGRCCCGECCTIIGAPGSASCGVPAPVPDRSAG